MLDPGIPLILGTNTFGWTSSRDESWAVLERFIEHGGRYVDTADVYRTPSPDGTVPLDQRSSEHIIGGFLAQSPGASRLRIITKVGGGRENPGLSRDNIHRGADQSLQALGVDSIDVFMAHRDDPSVPIEESVGAFGELLADRRIAAIALSNYSGERLTEWLATSDRLGVARPVAIQSKYSLVTRREVESAILPVAVEHGVGLLPYGALASGFLTGKYVSAEAMTTADRARFLEPFADSRYFRLLDVLKEVAGREGLSVASAALAWVRSRPGVIAPLASARSIAQLDELLVSAQTGLTPDALAELDAASQEM